MNARLSNRLTPPRSAPDAISAQSRKLIESAFVGTVVLFDFSADIAPDTWLESAAGRLIEHLRWNERETEATAVVALVPAQLAAEALPFAEAAVGALRGIVQSTTRERAHHTEPLNLVVGTAGDLDAVAETLKFLSDRGGAYVAGATLDLRVGRTHLQ